MREDGRQTVGLKVAATEATDVITELWSPVEGIVRLTGPRCCLKVLLLTKWSARLVIDSINQGAQIFLGTEPSKEHGYSEAYRMVGLIAFLEYRLGEGKIRKVVDHLD